MIITSLAPLGEVVFMKHASKKFAVLSITVDNSWSFEDLTPSQTSYITHSYHRYPAKFIPQLAARVILENSLQGDLVCDPFMGSATTLVETIVHDRKAYGTDINPVAALIARAKTTPIAPAFLEKEVKQILRDLHFVIEKDQKQMRLTDHRGKPFEIKTLDNPRIDYWFPEKQKQDLAIILSRINAVKDPKIRDFLLCGFSNILKLCSRWLMKSVKPTIDKDKLIADAYKSFSTQAGRMLKKNEEFFALVGQKQIECIVDNVDARRMNLKNNSVTLIVTSPPYVTSYEYADLHQLSALWLEYTRSLPEFRKGFIGSVQKENGPRKLYSNLGKETIEELHEISKREANGVTQYFYEMQQCFEEMYRVLEEGGRAAIVVGDTDLRKVKIQNAIVFIETMEAIGFKRHDVILRPIPSKILPLTRDEKTGKFTSKISADRHAYPTEHIIIMEKTIKKG
jgi:DNA modification methylase